MILEGSYPYVHGGVSSWMHQYIQAMPEVDFVLWCIGAQAGNRGHYKYELPEISWTVTVMCMNRFLTRSKKEIRNLRIF